MNQLGLKNIDWISESAFAYRIPESKKEEIQIERQQNLLNTVKVKT